MGAIGAPGPQGPAGARGSVASTRFTSVNVSQSGALSLPAGSHSVIYLVRTPVALLTLTLPDPATAIARFITVRRVDTRGVVLVSGGDAPIEGGREIRMLRGRDEVVSLPSRWDWVTFVTDGSTWFVFENGQ